MHKSPFPPNYVAVRAVVLVLHIGDGLEICSIVAQPFACRRIILGKGSVDSGEHETGFWGARMLVVPTRTGGMV